MNKRKLGDEYELRAVKYLEGKGYRILNRNFRAYYGEIDIVAHDGKYLVFVEVKYRRSGKYGYSAEAVGKKKQEIIYKVAMYYINLHRQWCDMPCRFDVIAIDNDSVEHIENAFGGL